MSDLKAKGIRAMRSRLQRSLRLLNDPKAIPTVFGGGFAMLATLGLVESLLGSHAGISYPVGVHTTLDLLAVAGGFWLGARVYEASCSHRPASPER